MINCHFDFETFSEADIKKVGGYCYSQHPSTEVLCMAYAYENEPPEIILPGDMLPAFLREESHGQYYLHAWNSAFEYGVLKNVMWIEPPPLEFWMDSAAMATAMALPAGLDKCCTALGVPESLAKDKRGDYLVKKSGLCKPVRKKRNTDPKLLEELYDYCKRDVIAEREIHNKYLIELSPAEKQLWQLDQEINFRGIQIDIPNVEHAMVTHGKKSDQLKKQLQEMTGLDNPNSWQQFLPWAQALGYTGENLQKETIETFVEEMKNGNGI